MDWTADPQSGRSNSSELYLKLRHEVARLLADGAAGSVLSQNWISGKAGLIMAQLAHIHHLAPKEQDMDITITRGKPSPPPPDRITLYRYGRDRNTSAVGDVWSLTIPEAEEMLEKLLEALRRYKTGRE